MSSKWYRVSNPLREILKLTVILKILKWKICQIFKNCNNKYSDSKNIYDL